MDMYPHKKARDFYDVLISNRNRESDVDASHSSLENFENAIRHWS